MKTTSKQEQSDLIIDETVGMENKVTWFLISPGQDNNRPTAVQLVPDVARGLENGKGQNFINCASSKVTLTHSPSVPLNRGLCRTQGHLKCN